MNSHRTYYFIKQQQEELERRAKTQEIKNQELQFRELVLKETQRLTQIKHETEIENLRHEKEITRQLLEEEINMLGILHSNEKILLETDYKHNIFQMENELQHYQHKFSLLEIKNEILKEQSVSENKRSQILQEKYFQLQDHTRFKDEYWIKINEINERLHQIREEEFYLKEEHLNLQEGNLHLKHGEQSLKMERGLFEQQRDRKLQILESLYADLDMDKFRLEIEENKFDSKQELIEIDYRKKEIDLKEEWFDQKLKITKAIHQEEKRRLHFQQHHADIEEQIEMKKRELSNVRNDIISGQDKLKEIEIKKDISSFHLRKLRKDIKKLE